MIRRNLEKIGLLKAHKWFHLEQFYYFVLRKSASVLPKGYVCNCCQQGGPMEATPNPAAPDLLEALLVPSCQRWLIGFPQQSQ
jgi:hypothetical protein